jgi:predicted AlkP superfamily pyrophosphatase or phosphodiesterase
MVGAGQSEGAGPVVVISVDGLRPDAIPATSTPVLDALIVNGSYHPAAQSVFPYDTMNNHATMVTGTTPLERGILLNTDLPGKIPNETIFEIAKRAGMRTGFFAGKDKLAYLADQEDMDVVLIEGDMQVMTNAVVRALNQERLDLVFVHYRHPDSAGHADGWMSAAYLAKVSEVDGLIGEVAEALGVPGAAKGGTILLTADHGGEGLTHFLPTSPTVNIPWLLVGAEAAIAKRLTGSIAQNDLAPTVLALLGLGIPGQMNGRVVGEAFADASLSAPFLKPSGGEARGCGTGLFPAFATMLAWFWLRPPQLMK